MSEQQSGEKPKLLQMCVSRSEPAPDLFFDILIIFYNQPILVQKAQQNKQEAVFTQQLPP